MLAADCTGLVLAGGQSRRFGKDKARHEVDGQTMIEQVVDVVAAVAKPVLISVGVSGHRFDRLHHVSYVADCYKEAGPLAGLHAGLEAIETPWLLAVACDMPFLDTATLQRLLAARTSGTDAVVAKTSDGRWHPLCACYHSRTLPVVKQQLEAHHLVLHALLDRLAHVRAVDLPAPPLRNVNRPADLQEAKG